LTLNERDSGENMSDVLEKEKAVEAVEETIDIAEASQNITDAVTSLLETLVPPKDIQIVDVFGNEYELPTSVSARKQIKILREFEKLKDIPAEKFSIKDGTPAGIVSMIVDIAMNEIVFDVICKCFYTAHTLTVLKAKTVADEEGVEVEKDHLGVGDLFPIEEIVSGIVPLFIRLARRTGSALAVLSK